LASCVAALVAGHYLHAERIVDGQRPGTELQASAVDAAIRRLRTVDSHQRDGWIFQMISWVAARLVSSDKTLAAPPQIRTADKGFDGLLLELQKDTGLVAAVVICEDKATEHPRRRIQRDVWREIRNIESGARDNELVSEVATILRASSQLAIEEVLEQIYWDEERCYRVSVTAGASHGDATGRERLFRGYDQVAAGDVGRRRGETVRIPNLRDWLERFCDSVIAKLEEMKAD